MSVELVYLFLTAISISCLHTLAGPDHYLPFIALSKSRGWSIKRTIFWVIICGCAHVWSSVLLALGGAAIGWSLSSIQWIESLRGGIAAWILILFGFLYTLWGLITLKTHKHRHFDYYPDGSVYVYEHKEGEVVSLKERHKVTPWLLFLIFVLGPCEPMVPLLYLPAVQSSWWVLIVLVLVYTFFTLCIMLVIVVLSYRGITLMKLDKWERFFHPFSGLFIFICGAGMVFLDW